MQVSNTQLRQRGVAMVISMIMLVLVSVVVLSAARSSNLELLIGNNTQQSATALMRAENSVLVGETVIENNFVGAPTDFDFSREDGFYLEEDLDLNTTDWSELKTEVIGSGYNKFEYVVEYIGPETASGSSVAVGAGGSGSNLIYLYRVSGRGDAGIGGARVVQTIYATAD